MSDENSKGPGRSTIQIKATEESEITDIVGSNETDMSIEASKSKISKIRASSGGAEENGVFLAFHLKFGLLLLFLF